MEYNSINQYTLQSYFKSLCNSFKIAYEQRKRLKKEKEGVKKELEESGYYKEVDIINKISGIYLEEKEKYERFVQLKYSKEQIEKVKKELQAEIEKKEGEYESIRKQIYFWEVYMADIAIHVESICQKIESEGYKIIVTKEEELLVLVYTYITRKEEKIFDILKIDSESLPVFPKGEISELILKTFFFERDEDQMEKVYNYLYT